MRAFLVAVVLTLVPRIGVAAPPSAEPARDERSMFELDVGGSWQQVTHYGTVVRSVLFGPTAIAGWKPSGHLAVGGGLALQLGGAYDTIHDVTEKQGLVLWPRAFAWLDYRPVARGPLHAGAVAGLGFLMVVGDYCDCGNLSGNLGANERLSFVAAPHVGFDWRAGSSWRVGPLARFWLSPGEPSTLAAELAVGLVHD